MLTIHRMISNQISLVNCFLYSSLQIHVGVNARIEVKEKIVRLTTQKSEVANHKILFVLCATGMCFQGFL